MEYEGFRARPYICPAGKKTVGFGHVMQKGKQYPATITMEEAKTLLREDVKTAEAVVNSAVKVPLNQNQFDALVSFVFNLGGGALRRSTLLKILNQGEYIKAAIEFKKWNKARVNGRTVVLPGLVKRRERESDLFTRPVIL